MNKHLSMQLPKMQEHILNVIGLQQLLRKQGNICMNICELPMFHKASKSFQLQDFQSLLQHNGSKFISKG
jgi:hypothetical protein